MQTNRRNFLRTSFAAATAACGLARLNKAHADTSAEIALPEFIIDTHVYLGHWPHGNLSSSDPSELLAMLRRNNVLQAWVGSFDGLFHKDIAGVNQRLADACSQNSGATLIPFGTINPTLPDWEEDVRRCHETFHMPGIRLHPNYHGYTLDDARFARLLELAAARRLIVHLVAWLEDQRDSVLNPSVAQVELKALTVKLARMREIKLIVANGFRTLNDESMGALLPMKQIYFDFARAESAAELGRLVRKASPGRVLFGSCAPLHNLEPVLTKMQGAQLTEDDTRLIAMKNAAELTRVNPF